MSRDGRKTERKRGLARRGESVRGTSDHEVTTCPGCRSHFPTLKGFSEIPDECPNCDRRLCCEACGSPLVETDPEEFEDGMCPRCEKPVDGEEAGHGAGDFTWNDH